MSIWALVPVKPFSYAKSRLSELLTGEERAGLSRQFLWHTLAVLAEVPTLAGTMVISRDPAALAMARDAGARGVGEGGGGELNAALEAATSAAQAAGAEAVLILPADLPMLTPSDVEHLLQSRGDGPSVCIAPDRHELGTNALVVQPAGVLRYRFGQGSFARHLAQAGRAGAAVHVTRRPGLALDVDVPEDWHLFQSARQA